MSTLERRVSALEQRLMQPGQPTLYFCVYDEPPIGFYFDDTGGERVRVMLEPGEGEKELRARAAAAARMARPRKPPMLFSIQVNP